MLAIRCEQYELAAVWGR